MSVASERAYQSVLEEFDAFRSRIEPTEKEKSDISASHNRMRGLLENSPDLVVVVDSFLTGSYARDTMIRPLQDVDFLVKLHYGKHKNEAPFQLLNKLKGVLSRAYPSTPISVTPPCVTVKFGFCFLEIVPAFGVDGNEELFKIPTSNGMGWQETYPRIPHKWMTEENKKSEGLFKPTIKMLKRWRDVLKVPLRSFHLEMLARMAFSKYTVTNYFQGVWAFFKISKDLLEGHVTPFVVEPYRPGTFVDQYLYNNLLQKTIATARVGAGLGYVDKAFGFINQGYAGFAKGQLSNVFGADFHSS